MILGFVSLLLIFFTNDKNKEKMDLNIQELTYINENGIDDRFGNADYDFGDNGPMKAGKTLLGWGSKRKLGQDRSVFTVRICNSRRFVPSIER